MPSGGNTLVRITDKRAIRRCLNADREWSLYALADLDDGMFEQCDWWSNGHGLALVFRALNIRPIVVFAGAASTRELLTALPEACGDLNLKLDQVAAAAGVYQYRERREMRRMFLDGNGARESEAVPVTRADLPAIERLYQDGGGGTAFASFQLDSGFFRGVRRGNRLVAVAGVQAVSTAESIAAIGNVVTHPAWRGHGLARATVSAVVAALRRAGIATIGLNVEDSNTPAIRAYERIGFRTRLRYIEGAADRVAPLID
jgi:ribosomal protein S18 acetylase RimI-like enzyme